jgi:hypothetical protein
MASFTTHKSMPLLDSGVKKISTSQHFEIHAFGYTHCYGLVEQFIRKMTVSSSLSVGAECSPDTN